MKHLVVLIAVTACFAYSQSNSVSAGLKGIVSDQSGTPVPGAMVYALPQDGFNDAFPISVKSDRNGGFDFRGKLTLGTYKLYSRKAEDGYPDPLDKFYEDAKAETPAIALTKTHPSATVSVKLGPPPAVVAGRILDADSGDKLVAYLSFMDGEGHGHSVHVDGDYRIVLPPGKDVTLMVTLLDPASNRSMVPLAPLRLEPGQYVNLDIPVRR